MFNLVDNFLNYITMYRLILYYLIALLLLAAVYSFVGLLPFSVVELAFTVMFLISVCWVSNMLFAKVFHSPTNVESVYISALILALIISPAKPIDNLPFLFWAGVLAMGSKFILALHKKHIFNPVALAVAITALVLGKSANWWVGTTVMLPVVLIGGILVVRKIRKFDLVAGFLLMATLTIGAFTLSKNESLLVQAQRVLLNSPLLFLAFIMLTEPLTTPPTKNLQFAYGALVGFLFAPQIHLGNFYTTPELALLGGNIFSYLVSPKQRLMLKLREKIQIAPDIFDFQFVSDQKLDFKAGQYLEWTLPHQNPDDRGNRRFFTIASSPTESAIQMGIKFYDQSSSFKQKMLSLQKGDEIVASQLAGEFTLPKDPQQKLVFIAGGIGITPFRSMIKYLLDLKQKRSIVLFYSNNKAEDIVYEDLFLQAYHQLGIKTVYTLTDLSNIPQNWWGEKGRITPQIIETEVPDYKERTFYISGPKKMVDSFKQVLSQMGLSSHQVKTDFFPGFA
ncbi:RnfABCDGE type electron transport complex subunit D [Patescibacteria group bacterium]|nr:RnfABCDGE type electron transport complex subunit D [Patescibacteria group bacterium]